MKTLSRHSELAKAFAYALNQWPALTYYADDGWAEADNNIAENALRMVSLGRKNSDYHIGISFLIEFQYVFECATGSHKSALMCLLSQFEEPFRISRLGAKLSGNIKARSLEPLPSRTMIVP